MSTISPMGDMGDMGLMGDAAASGMSGGGGGGGGGGGPAVIPAFGIDEWAATADGAIGSWTPSAVARWMRVG